MTAANKLVSGTSMHVLNVGQKRLITMVDRALLRFSH
jgi:hypothetical protein